MQTVVWKVTYTQQKKVEMSCFYIDTNKYREGISNITGPASLMTACVSSIICDTTLPPLFLRACLERLSSIDSYLIKQQTSIQCDIFHKSVLI